MGGVHVPHLVLHVSDLHDNCHHHCRSRDGLVFRSSLICIWRTWHTHVEFQRNAVGTRLCMFAFWNSRGDDSAVPAVFGVDDLCPERPENRNFAQTNRQDLRYRQTIQLQHIATSTDTALSTDHARRHLLADLSCDILLEPVAKLGLWLHDAELSCLRASPGRLDRWLSPSKAWADWNIEVKRCQAFISLQTRPDWSTKTRACSYHGYAWPSSVSVFLRRFLSFAIALEPWKQFCHDPLVLWSIPVGIQSQRCFGIFGGGVGDLQAVPACAFWGVYGLNKYVLWIGACTSVASIKFSVSSRMPCAHPSSSICADICKLKFIELLRPWPNSVATGDDQKLANPWLSCEASARMWDVWPVFHAQRKAPRSYILLTVARK